MTINWRSRENKYGARRVKAYGFTFASQGEARRYEELRFLEGQGLVFLLKVHPRYDLRLAGEKVCTYVADFEYRDQQGNRHVEDFKGVMTPMFKLKRKLFKALMGIDVEIVTGKK